MHSEIRTPKGQGLGLLFGSLLSAVLLLVACSARLPQGTVPDFATGGVASVPVTVHSKDLYFQGLSEEHFSVTENGVPRKVVAVDSDPDAPVFLAVAIEYSRALPTVSNRNYAYRYPFQDVIHEAVQVAYELAQTLRTQDRMAVLLFDVQSRVLLDFTGDKWAIEAALTDLLNDPFGPMSSESDTFSTVGQTLLRLRPAAAKNRVALVVLGTGQATMGAWTLDAARNTARGCRIPVFFVRTGWRAAELLDQEAQYSQPANPWIPEGVASKFNFAEAQGRAVAASSGGAGYQLRFVGQASEFAKDIVARLRAMHVLVFEAPALPARKLSKLKIKVTTPLNETPASKIRVDTVDGRRGPDA